MSPNELQLQHLHILKKSMGSVVNSNFWKRERKVTKLNEKEK